MISIEERRCEKLSGFTSLFFSSLNQDIINHLNYLTNAYIGKNITPLFKYNENTKEYEIPIFYLSELVEECSKYDDVELKYYENSQKPTLEQQNFDYRVKLFDYQKEALEYGLCNNKWLLLDEQGLGKTPVMIHLAEELYKKGEIEHCFIVCCVNSLKANWKKEIVKHSELGLGCKVLGERVSSRGNIINGSVKDRIKDLTTPIDEFFIITNIETLRSDEFIKTYNSKKNKNKIDMIVVDEIHKASNSSSDQGKGLLKLKAKYQVALTGTLLTNSPLSAYLPLKWIGEEKGNKGTCKAEYCVYRGYGDAVLLAGYKNLDAFKEEIDNCSLRRTKEVLKDELPPKTILEEYVSLSDSHRKFYEEVKNGVKDSCDKINLDTNQTLSLITRLRQATGCPSALTTENITSSKLERAVELTQDLISSGEKVVIFSTFKESVYKLAEMLKENNPLICTGDNKDEEISVNIDKFQNDDEHFLLIGTHQKMGTGVTLNRASYMIFIDTPFTYSDYAQACDRIHRIGSKNPVFIYNLICEDTIDEKVNDIVMTKKDLSDYVIDNENLTNRLRRMLLEL